MTVVKSKAKILKNFVAFSEYMNFSTLLFVAFFLGQRKKIQEVE